MSRPTVHIDTINPERKPIKMLRRWSVGAHDGKFFLVGYCVTDDKNIITSYVVDNDVPEPGKRPSWVLTRNTLYILMD